MTRTALALGGALLALALQGCNDHNRGNARTLTSIVRSEIARYTSDTTLPVDVNTLPVDTSDTTDTAKPSSL